MSRLSDRQAVECFHLLFLAQLGRKVDKRRYALKGGCNLRFFFHSPRYSEDMDLDVAGIPVHALKEKVSGILTARPLQQILQVRNIAIEQVSAAKQTTTTQRWKLHLSVPGIEVPVPTKIEFSRRNMDTPVRFEAVDSLLTTEYRMQSVMTNHYLADAAYQQKIHALANRRETQARDIFDLHILLNAGSNPDNLPDGIRDILNKAKDKTLLVDWDAFRSQVVAYLPFEDQQAYDNDVWDAMRLRVYEALDRTAQ